LLKKLGKFTTSVGCLYIKILEDVDRKVLKELVQASVKRMKQLGK
jgi:chromosome condensin MukBEF MukE localization factor